MDRITKYSASVLGSRGHGQRKRSTFHAGTFHYFQIKCIIYYVGERAIRYEAQVKTAVINGSMRRCFVTAWSGPRLFILGYY